MTAKIPAIYRPIVDNEYLYYVFYGGRGAGKTENIAQILVLLACQTRLRILCIREIQNSIKDSVKAVIEKWIDKLGLENEFYITDKTIRTKCGSEFLFVGMQSHNAVNVKSISDINITWIEEAEAFSRKSWELLVPSVIRTPNPRIIITFNPLDKEDVIYDEFIIKSPPAHSYIRKVNYNENPFFQGTTLEAQMLNDKERIPPSEFNHKWLGELATHSEASLFQDAKVLNTLFNRDDYERVIIACDPATTNKDYSNEYGIIVAGIKSSGEINIINDLSGNYSPIEFASEVNTAHTIYHADAVVVEVNNGGDFIKSAILQINPHLRVKEVRACADKVQRALPVASMVSLHNVTLLTSLPKLARQMRLLTSKGYMGSRGESPDRLDAMVWAVYELAGLRDRDSIWQVFDSAWFEKDTSYKSYLLRKNVTYVWFNGVDYYYIRFNIYKHTTDYRVEILEANCAPTAPLNEPANTFLNDCEATSLLFTQNPSLQGYSAYKNKTEDLVNEVLLVFKSRKVFFSTDGAYKDLKLDLMEFSYNSERNFHFLRVLCEMVRAEFLG